MRPLFILVAAVSCSLAAGGVGRTPAVHVSVCLVAIDEKVMNLHYTPSLFEGYAQLAFGHAPIWFCVGVDAVVWGWHFDTEGRMCGDHQIERKVPITRTNAGISLYSTTIDLAYIHHHRDRRYSLDSLGYYPARTITRLPYLQAPDLARSKNMPTYRKDPASTIGCPR